jgi:hypothetical protein
MLSMPLYHFHVYWKCGRSVRGHPIRRNSMSTLSMSKFRAILLAITFAGAPLCGASHAQDLEGAVVVNVPFAFEYGSGHFRPGLYTIRMESRNILELRGEKGSSFAMTNLDEDNRPSKTTKVVFRRYGDQYFLHEVWVEGETSHTSSMPSKAEKLEISANRTAPRASRWLDWKRPTRRTCKVVRTEPGRSQFPNRTIRNWTGAPRSPQRTWAE